MWLRFCIGVISLGIISFSWAQVPDEESLLREITSNRSDNYYPNLMMRFEQGDTTLTLDNYHHLYYGFAYEEQYKPLNVNPHMDSFLMLAAGLDPEAPQIETLYRIIRVGEDVLESDPFNLKVWNLLAFAYGAMGQEQKEIAAYDRVQKILSTIKLSGSGIKEDSPQHILMFDHALDLMAAENLNHTKARVISRTVEFIPLVAPRTLDGKKIKGFYFDFSRVYWNKPDSVTYKRDRTWQFNNLKPREYK